MIASGSSRPGRVGVATSEAHVRIEDGDRIVCARSGDLTLEADRNLTARIDVIREARPLIRCRSGARVAIEASASSAPRIIAEDQASLTVIAVGASTPVIELHDRSTSRIYARDASAPSLRQVGSGSYRLVVQDSATPHIDGWPDGWEPRPSEIYVGQEVVCFPSKRMAQRAAEAFFGEWNRTKSRSIAAQRTPGAIPMVCADSVDFRWARGTIHLELPGDGSAAAWYSPDAHDPHAITEESRARCHKTWLGAASS